MDLAKCPERKSGHRRAQTAADGYAREKEFAKALACYVSALSSNGDFAPAFYGIGEMYSRKIPQSFELARESYELAIEEWPEYLDAHLALGDLWQYSREDYVRAEMLYREAVRLKPTDALSWDAMSNSLRMQGKLDQALANYNKAIAQVEIPLGLYYGRAQVYSDMGDYAACAADVSKVIEEKDDYIPALYLRANCMANITTGDNVPPAHLVEKFYREIFEKEKTKPEYLISLIKWIYQSGRELRVKALRNLLKVGGKNKAEYSAKGNETWAEFVAEYEPLIAALPDPEAEKREEL